MQKKTNPKGSGKPRLLDWKPPNSTTSSDFTPPIEDDDKTEPHVFFDNPFYDKVFAITLDGKLRTYQSKSIKSRREYKNLVTQMMSQVHLDESMFPTKETLLIVLQFSAPRVEIWQSDLDNLAKIVIDSMAGIFFHNDRQVVMLWVDKSPGMLRGCKVGLRLITDDLGPQVEQLYFSESEMRGIVEANGIDWITFIESIKPH